jgi:hypothetical protein
MSITGTEVDKALGPKDWRSKDTVELYNAAVDITALPGMLGSQHALSETSEDASNTTKMAATIIASAMGGRSRHTQIHDSLW